MTRVLIAGAGIGGLTLAQALHRAGVEVSVFERDRTRTDRLQGYRVHIAPYGNRALHEALPPERYAEYVATSGAPNTTLSFVDHRLTDLLTLDSTEVGVDLDHPVDSYRSVSRFTFREVLLGGLDGTVHFDKAVTGYTETPGGPVALRFADGTSAEGDVLVGADGVNSRVRAQLLPHAVRVDTGAVGIAGKVPLSDATRQLLPRQFFTGSVLLLAPGGRSGFLAVHEFRRATEQTRDYIMWNVLGTWPVFGDRAEVSRLDGAGLRDLALRVTRDWHPDLRTLIGMSDVDSLALLPLRTSTRVGQWPTNRVTLLGDAVHSMPPTAGAGANTALVDAAVLARELVAADRGERDVLAALERYEAEMVPRAFGFVRRADQNLKMAVSANPVGRALFTGALRLVSRIGPVRRRMAAGLSR